MTKICSMCGSDKSIDLFFSDKSKRDGKRNECKECTGSRQKKYYESNKPRIAEQQKIYYQDNKEEIKKRQREYNLVHSEQIAASKRVYNETHKEKISLQKKEYRDSHIEQIAVVHRKWVAENLERVTEYKKEWYQSNKPKISKKKRKDLEERPEKIMLLSAKTRAKSLGLPFTISEDDIPVPEFCPVLGLKLEVGLGTSTESSPSLDKLVPEKGYVRGNCFVISNRANRIKANGTAENHRRIAAWMKEQAENPSAPGLNPFFGEEESRLIYKATERSKEKDIELSIAPEDIAIPDTCPILGIPLKRGKNKRHDGSPTLDRIDSNKGYVVGNIGVLSYRANWIKNDGTVEEHLKIADWMDAMSEQRIAA